MLLAQCCHSSKLYMAALRLHPEEQVQKPRKKKKSSHSWHLQGGRKEEQKEEAEWNLIGRRSQECIALALASPSVLPCGERDVWIRGWPDSPAQNAAWQPQRTAVWGICTASRCQLSSWAGCQAALHGSRVRVFSCSRLGEGRAGGHCAAATSADSSSSKTGDVCIPVRAEGKVTPALVFYFFYLFFIYFFHQPPRPPARKSSEGKSPLCWNRWALRSEYSFSSPCPPVVLFWRILVQRLATLAGLHGRLAGTVAFQSWQWRDGTRFMG